MEYFFAKISLKIVGSKKIKWMLSKSYPSLFFLPHMTWDEYSLFKKLCRSRTKFLEFGSGGSTIFLLKKNKEVFSVESNPEFFKYMNSISIVKNGLNRKLYYRFIDLGNTNKWGKPISSERSVNWASYYSDVWNDINPAKDKIEAVFIDGRFRVCCCLYSILKVIEYQWSDTIFIIHDFWRREKYHAVLKFLTEIESSSNLASFKVREGIDVGEVKIALSEFADDFS